MTKADPSPTEPDDLHEWLSLEIDGATYLFDVTFLLSTWTCLFGRGCMGVLTGPAPELSHGCCTYGAHFVDKDDRKKIKRLATELTDDEWQFRAVADELGGPIHKNGTGEWVTHTVDDACIFLNRVDSPMGAGCALHLAALHRDERPLDWKPVVCWQLPLRLDEHAENDGHSMHILREWKRRDWGEGGAEFHWWCTETDEAFVGDRRVYETLRDEIVELVGEEPYDALCKVLEQRRIEVALPHPALKRGPAPAD